MTPERQIENEIFKYLKSIGIFCFKVDRVGIYDPKRKVYRKNHNPHRIVGISDIMGILPDGRFLAIEVKAPKGYLSGEQKDFIKHIIDNNGVAFMARSVDEAEKIVSLALGLVTTRP